MIRQSHLLQRARPAIGLVMAALLAGCTSQQMYATGQQAQRSQCMQLVEQAAVDRCLQQSDLPYEHYTPARTEGQP